jgi:hypothetical protein
MVGSVGIGMSTERLVPRTQNIPRAELPRRIDYYVVRVFKIFLSPRQYGVAFQSWFRISRGLLKGGVPDHSYSASPLIIHANQPSKNGIVPGAVRAQTWVGECNDEAGGWEIFGQIGLQLWRASGPVTNS